MFVIEIYTSVRFTLNYHEKCLGIVLNGFGCLPKSYCFLLCSLVTIGWVSQRHRMVLIEWHGHWSHWISVVLSFSCWERKKSSTKMPMTFREWFVMQLVIFVVV